MIIIPLTIWPPNNWFCNALSPEPRQREVKRWRKSNNFTWSWIGWLRLGQVQISNMCYEIRKTLRTIQIYTKSGVYCQMMVPWIHDIQKLRFWLGLCLARRPFPWWYINHYCVQPQLASVKNDNMSNDFRRRNSSLELKDRFPDLCSKILWYWLVSNQKCSITIYYACIIFHQALLEQEAARRRLHEENQVGMIMILN